MRILVCGSRDYADQRRVHEVLDHFLYNITGSLVIVEGCARGADRLAEAWAATHNIAILHNPADWNKHGRAAGSIRNRRMVAEHDPHMVIAFYTDRTKPSRGTSDMVRVAKAADIPVVVA